MKCCPDTGATQTVIHERIARQADLILNPPRIGMNRITGPMDIVGEANVVLKFDGLKHTTFALIARGMDFTYYSSLARPSTAGHYFSYFPGEDISISKS